MDPLNLILLIIVALIFWRLRSVLGMRDEDEQPGSRKDAYRLNRDAFENRPRKVETLKEADAEPAPPADEGATLESAAIESEDNEPQAALNQAPQDEIEEAPRSGRGLAVLRAVDPSFDEAGFLDGAGRAYEMILTAFADGALDGVRGFLGDDVAAGFEAAIAARHEADEQLVTRILRLDRPALDDARIEDDFISLDVRFRAEMISFTCPQGAAIDEDALPAPATAYDVWTFARARDSQDLNWALVATQSA